MKERRSFLSILCFILISFGVASVSAQTCIQNRKYFTPSDTYDANRHSILSSLPSNAAARDGFYNGSVGEEPNRIYAVGMCIPGADANDCSSCIKGASDWLKQDCTNQTDAYYWALDPTLCLVRYANAAFSGASAFWEITPQYLVMNTAIIKSNLTEFKNIWEDLTVRMFAAASASRSTPTSSNNHYTANVVALSKFQNIYALMHCTPDISPGDCDNCLRLGVGEYQNCCANNTGGYVMRPICFFRWQSFTFSKAFGNITLAPPPSPSPSRPLSPPPLPRPAIASQPPSAADPAKTKENSSGNTMRTIVAIFVGVVVIIIIISGLFVWWFARSRREKPFQEVELNQNVAGVTTVRSLQFKYKTIKEATNNFSTKNEIAKGGFGEVFKGILPDGKEIAVKRLFATNEQSTKEFKNEVVVVAKLQHRNLVKLIGFSVKGEEKIIVYELLPNKSLDYILFEPTRQGELDWKKRYEIIKGTARGILYLHHGSRLTIIHRDLKPGNILLDNDMNPKIADFGTARIFGMDQTRAHTKKGVGTPGYMPPEYINEWQFSVKTDVYSFGVIVLEIICGKADKSFTSQALNLVTYAWRLWINGSPLDLLDPTIAGNFQTEKVTRCIHIALLCVQEDPEDRPDFSIIMSMLTSKSLILDVPKTPGLCIPDRSHQSTTRSSSQTINDGT